MNEDDLFAVFDRRPASTERVAMRVRESSRAVEVIAEAEEGCPDCGRDSVVLDADDTPICSHPRCGWRE